jgi:hypothetical protein
VLGYIDGMSLYEYVKSNPLSGTDPSGNIAVADDAVVALVVGGVLVSIEAGQCVADPGCRRAFENAGYTLAAHTASAAQAAAGAIWDGTKWVYFGIGTALVGSYYWCRSKTSSQTMTRHPGQKCPDTLYDKLWTIKQAMCFGGWSCSPGMSCKQAIANAALATACANARRTFQSQCFNRSDPDWEDHQSKISDEERAANNCNQIVAAGKCV